MKRGPAFVILTILVIFFCAILLPSSAHAHKHKHKRDGRNLHVGFYKWRCPQAERIVANVVWKAVTMNSGLAAGLIRLHFHDCFVNGCDASLLLDSTPSGEPVEKESRANGPTLRGLEVIDEAKAWLEEECPGIVSCADTLAFAAREAVVLSGLPRYPVPAGRRDGCTSSAEDVRGNIPSFKATVKDMTAVFLKKGLTREELVILSGAHSIGVAHCPSFSYRLYNFSLTQDQDPSMDMYLASYLKWMCPKPGTLFAHERVETAAVLFDAMTPNKLDSSFYQKLLQGRVLLQSDQELANDPRTSEIVQKMAFNPREWPRKFGKAMIRMGRVDVLTGYQGEIRKHCRSVN